MPARTWIEIYESAEDKLSEMLEQMVREKKRAEGLEESSPDTTGTATTSNEDRLQG